MSNRETYPSSQSPLKGDIDGPAGATTVTVVGIQRQPVSPAVPVDQDTFRYNQGFPRWEPKADGNSSVRIGTYQEVAGQIVSKGTTISDDYEFLVNNVDLDVLVGWAYGYDSQVFENGSPI